MSKRINVCIIPQPEPGDLELPPLRMESCENTLQWYQAVVGGWIDVLTAERFALVIHDEGKFEPKCRPNVWATRIASCILGPDDYIAGTCVMYGPDTHLGENMDVPPDTIRWLLAQGVPIRDAANYLGHGPLPGWVEE